MKRNSMNNRPLWKHMAMAVALMVTMLPALPAKAQDVLPEREAAKTAYMDVVNVDFVNIDGEYNIINDGLLYDSEIKYILPVLMYDGIFDVERTVTVSGRLYEPNGTLMKGSKSPQGCTWEHTMTVKPGYNNQEILVAWGSDTPNTYSEGTYQFELWYQGEKLYKTTFTVEHKKPKITRNTTKLGRESEIYRGKWIKALEKCIVNVTESYSTDVYKGELRNGLRDGYGLYVWDDGAFYIGSWKKDKRDGFGLYMCADGYEIGGLPGAKFYSGFWTNSTKEGQGACFDEYGNGIYVGVINNDKPAYDYPNECSITFECVDLGEGMYFVGQVIDDEPFGFGMFISEDGDMVFGMYQDGAMTGKLLFLGYDGEVSSGTWDQIFGN